MPIFDHSKFLSVFLYQKGFNLYQSFWEKIVRKNTEQPFLAILNFF